MKQGIKYGFFLGGVLILSNIFYYFVHPIYMYSIFGKTMLLEILIYSIFMFLAISKSSDTIEDGGTFFKIAFLTLAIGLIISFLYRYTFSHALSEDLNSIYLEAKKADETNASDFFGNDPLATLETVELMEHTIEEDMTFLRFFRITGLCLLFFGIPFSILVTYLSKRILKFRKRKIHLEKL